MKSKLLFEIPSDITHQEKCIFKKALLESIDFKNALMDLKKSITCLNCKGILNEPKRLKCDHAFCHNCYNDFIHYKYKKNIIIKCPLCQEVR